MKLIRKYRKAIASGTAVVVAAVGRHYGLDSEIYLDTVGVAGVIAVILAKNVREQR